MRVSFVDYTPQPNFGGVPWSIIKINEGAAAVGPWNLIDTINIVDPDVDPSQPKARSFSTDNATLVGGWYQVIFQDVNGAQTVADPIQNVPPAQEPWYPSLSDVGVEILSRTKDSFGAETGTFTANTKPNELQALSIIRKAALDVADAVGDTIPDGLLDDAANVVAKRAAMMVERTYYSDQVNTDRSVYKQLKDEYDEAVVKLATQVQLVNQGDPGAVDVGVGRSPSYSFPPAFDILTRRI